MASQTRREPHFPRTSELIYTRGMVGPCVIKGVASVCGLALPCLLLRYLGTLHWMHTQWVALTVYFQSKFLAYLFMSFWAYAFTYWVLGGIMVLPVLFPQSWDGVRQWKIQPAASQTKNKSNIWGRFLPLITFNWLMAIFYSSAYCLAGKKEAFSAQKIEEMTADRMFWSAFVIVVLEEVGFFYTHWFIHAVPWLYKNIHKIHHEWTAPISWCAIYAHPIEHLVSNMGPISVGVMLTGPDAWSNMIMGNLAMIHSMSVHSGFFYCDDEGFHDMHHEKYSCNYGILAMMDLLHGTYREPRKPVPLKKCSEAIKEAVKIAELQKEHGFGPLIINASNNASNSSDCGNMSSNSDDCGDCEQHLERDLRSAVAKSLEDFERRKEENSLLRKRREEESSSVGSSSVGAEGKNDLSNDLNDGEGERCPLEKKMA